MPVRIQNTGADYEAQVYEGKGMSPEQAWSLVLRNFDERTKGIPDKLKELFKKFYFKAQGQMI